MGNNVKKIIPLNAGYLLKSVWLKYQALKYRGNNYYCPLCGKSYRTFLPGGFDLPVIKEKNIVGAGLRENNICPGCQSTDRDRLVFLYLEQNSDFFTQYNRVLHVAPEPALFNVFKKLKNIEYFPGTKYHEGFYYRKNIMKLDITSLDFENNKFDFVIANHILEHITDDYKAMKEILRVLKPGGQAILQVPIALSLNTTYENTNIKSAKEREKYFGQFDHVRLYGKDYYKRLEKTGFNVLKLKPNTDNWKVDNIDKYGINKNEYLYVCFKPK
jgi:SAM-dependent methyltransferase